MFQTDDAKRLRLRESALADGLGRQEPGPALGAPVLLARTTALTTYPTAAASFFACQPQSVLGTEIEGGPGTVTPVGSTFLALNLGTTVPPLGAQVVTAFVGNRWVFRYDS